MQKRTKVRSNGSTVTTVWQSKTNKRFIVCSCDLQILDLASSWFLNKIEEARKKIFEKNSGDKKWKIEIEDGTCEKILLSTEKGGLRANSHPYLVVSFHLKQLFGTEQMLLENLYFLLQSTALRPDESNRETFKRLTTQKNIW